MTVPFHWYGVNTPTQTQTSHNWGMASAPSSTAIYSTMVAGQQQTAQVAMMMQQHMLGGQGANTRAYGPSLYPLQGDVDADGALRLPQGWRGEIALEDGARLIVEDSKYRIEDKDAKVTYRANRVRQFNRYLNAGDLLQDFIADLGKAGARQSEILSVPIELFINWIILKAAEQDQDKPAEMLRPRCRWCGRYIARARLRAGITFCGEPHAVSFMRRAQLA